VNSSDSTESGQTVNATLNELSFHFASFWIQVHGLPLINMTTKIAISIGKGLGHLLQVDDSCSDKKSFKSFLRLLVEIEVSNPLKPGFPLQRIDDEPLWIFLKYERLDIYCTSCGRIGHKPIHCLAPPEESFLRGTLSLSMLTFFPTYSPTPHFQKSSKLSPNLNLLLLKPGLLSQLSCGILT
jgi:hypothetical protein